MNTHGPREPQERLTPLMVLVQASELAAAVLSALPLEQTRSASRATLADAHGCTHLHHAAWSGRTDTVRLLLHWGTDPLVADLQGRLPVDLAQSTEVRALLLQRSSTSDGVL